MGDQIRLYQAFVDMSGICVCRSIWDLEPGEGARCKGVWECMTVGLAKALRLCLL